jgi:acetaldehyde dehydrogenase (acetylating)
VKKAVRDIITGKTFDNGVLCSSENSVVVDQPIADDVMREFQGQGGYFMNAAEMEALARMLVTPQRLPNPALVGKTATFIAEKCGIKVPPETRVLIAPLQGVGRDYPLSIEKLCPVLSFYVVSDWREGCERCKEILRYGGMGHTMSIHSQNDQVILEFGLKKPAFRICVNTPTTLGSIGLTTGLDPAMTLGCGGYGGNITSDNISPKHLLNIKRLAYEIAPAVGRSAREPAAAELMSRVASPVPARVPQAGINARALSRRIDEFLGSRGYRGEGRGDPVRETALFTAKPGETAESRPGPSGPGMSATPSTPSNPLTPLTPATGPPPLEFVCEEDVRQAIQAGRKLLISERAIVTPAARDLAEEHRVITFPSWRS